MACLHLNQTYDSGRNLRCDSCGEVVPIPGLRPGEIHAVEDPAFLSPLAIQIAGTHYKDMSIQPVEFIHANKLGFLEGCIVKRICRWRAKDGIQDLEKIKHEVDLLIELEKRKK